MSHQVERSRWTDDRLDDFVGNVTKGIDGVRSDIAALRAEALQANDRLAARMFQLTLALIGGTLAIIAALIGFAG